jgi:hypothetical protein
MEVGERGGLAAFQGTQPLDVPKVHDRADVWYNVSPGVMIHRGELALQSNFPNPKTLEMAKERSQGTGDALGNRFRVHGSSYAFLPDVRTERSGEMTSIQGTGGWAAHPRSPLPPVEYELGGPASCHGLRYEYEPMQVIDRQLISLITDIQISKSIV